MHKSFTILERVAGAAVQAIAANVSGTAFDLKSHPLNLEFMNRFPSEETLLKKKVFSLDADAKQ